MQMQQSRSKATTNPLGAGECATGGMALVLASRGEFAKLEAKLDAAVAEYLQVGRTCSVFGWRRGRWGEIR